MQDKLWLDRVVLAAEHYNNSRLHTDFQQHEVLKFVEYLHQQYGIHYEMPKLKHRNEPHKVGT